MTAEWARRIRTAAVSEFGGRTLVALRRQGDRAMWTQLRIRRDGRPFEAAETRTVDLPIPDPAAPPEVAGAMLRPALSTVRGEVTLVWPADTALLRVLELPTTDPAELPDMVRLQLDRFSPFPTEHLVAAYEVIATAAGRTRVLVAAVQQAALDQEAAVLRAAGLDLRRVDLDVLGWWRNLAASGEAERVGVRIHLRMEGGSATVLATHDGVPVLLRSLGAGLGPDTPEELRDEIHVTLAALEIEWGRVGGALVVWFEDEPNARWAANLGEACGLPAEAASLADLPPPTEGAVRRALDDPTRVMNLAPPEWEIQRRARMLTRRFVVAALACFGLWLALVGGFLAALAVRETGLRRLARQVEILDKPANEVRAIQARIRSLEEYADRSRSALEILRQVSQDLPSGLTLTAFTVRKGKTLNLRGEADAVNAVYDFFAALERSGMFKEVKPEGITSKSTGGRARSEFRVSATLPGEDPA